MGALSLIAEALKFQRRHSVLLPVTLWLLAAPAVLRNLATRVLDVGTPILLHDTPPWQQPLLIGNILLLLLIVILQLWGQACILVTARRMLGHPAGRTRTAFMALLRDGVDYVPSMLATAILRFCNIVLLLLFALVVSLVCLWYRVPNATTGAIALVLAIPAILYSLHTSFYGVVIVGENLSFRSALRRSTAAFVGRKLRTYTTLLLVLLFAFAPSMALLQVSEYALPLMGGLTPRAAAFDVGSGLLEGVGILVATVALTMLYGQLRSHTVQQATVQTVAPKKKATKKKKTR